jgi:hypothetical protein
MITDCITLSKTGVKLKLANIYGIYRDRNPATKGDGIIRHWIKIAHDGKQSKLLYNHITHPEYVVIKHAAQYNQMRDTYIHQGTAIITED